MHFKDGVINLNPFYKLCKSKVTCFCHFFRTENHYQ